MVLITDAHGINLGNVDTAVSGKCGFKFTTNFPLAVISITKGASTVTSKAYILDSNKNVLYTANFVGSVATFVAGCTLTTNTTYYMASDNGGLVYKRNLTYTNQSWPKNKININYTGALDSGNDSLKGFNLLSIITEEIFPITEGFLEITGITAPESAMEGELVNFTVHTKNIGANDTFKVELSGDLTISQEFYLGAGLSKDVNFSFTMPNHSVIVNVIAYHLE